MSSSRLQWPIQPWCVISFWVATVNVGGNYASTDVIYSSPNSTIKQKEWRVKFRRPCRQLIGQLWGRSVCGGSVSRCAWVYLSQRGSAAAVLSTQKTTLSNMRGWLALWIWADNYKGRTNKHGGFNIFLVCCCHLSVQPGKKNWGEEKKEITMRCETDGPTSRPKGAPTLSFCPPLCCLFSPGSLLFHLLRVEIHLIVSVTLTWLVIRFFFFMIQPGLCTTNVNIISFIYWPCCYTPVARTVWWCLRWLFFALQFPFENVPTS